MTKSRGVLIVLVIAAALWAISLTSWQAGVAADTLGPSGVANVTDDSGSQASPIATSCVAIIAVTGLLSAMLGKIGRFIVLGLAGIAAVGYGVTALQSLSAPGATSWPIVALFAAAIALVVIAYVAFASARWTSTNRYARSAEADGDEFDSAATWDALSRGDDLDGSAQPESDDLDGGAQSESDDGADPVESEADGPERQETDPDEKSK